MSKNWYFKIVLFFCLLNFVLRLPFANMHLNFDEFNYVSGYESIFNNHLNPFIEFGGYKPPLMFIVPAFFSLPFGINQIIPRIFIYLCSSLLLWFVYLIARDIFRSKRVGMWGVILLFFYPMFITQSFLYQDPIPTALFFTMSFYFLYTNKYKYYILSSIALVMTREVGLLAIFIFALADLFFYKKSLLHAIKLHVPALIVLIVWMLLNKYFLGWYLWPYNVDHFKPSSIFSLEFLDYFKYVFISQFYFILLFFLFLPKKQFSKYKFIVSIILIINLYLSYSVSCLTRYLFFPVPIVILLLCYFSLNFFNNNYKNILLYLSIFVFIFGNIYNYLAPKNYRWGDEDLRLFKYITLVDDVSKISLEMCGEKCVFASDIFQVPMIIRRYYVGKNMTDVIWYNSYVDMQENFFRNFDHLEKYLIVTYDYGQSNDYLIKKGFILRDTLWINDFFGNKSRKVLFFTKNI